SSPEQRAQEEIAVEDSKQSHEQGEYEHESAPPEHAAHKEKVDEAATAKDLRHEMHVLAPVPRESLGSHVRALTIRWSNFHEVYRKLGDSQREPTRSTFGHASSVTSHQSRLRSLSRRSS